MKGLFEKKIRAFAGLIFQVYSGCGCEQNKLATKGLCFTHCQNLIAYISVFAIMSLLTSLVRIPGVVLQLR